MLVAKVEILGKIRMLAPELPYNRAVGMIYLEDSFGMSAGNNIVGATAAVALGHVSSCHVR